MTKGSLQYWPRKRARKRLPRIRNSRKTADTPGLSNIVGYKAGMCQLNLIDDSDSPSKSLEVNRACTIIEIPKTELYGIRFYKRNSITKYLGSSDEVLNAELCKKIGMKNIENNELKLEAFKGKLKDYVDVSALLVAYPKTVSVEQHKPVRFEAKIIANDIAQKFEIASGLLGKEVKAIDIFKNGEFIDVTSISKGKGWSSAIKRHHIARLDHKATQKTRHMGVLGSYGMGRVLYSVPHSGQLGFNYRTEYNKRLLKISSDKLDKKQGFRNYGSINSDYIIIEGSIPGPAKRLVRLRKTLRNKNKNGIKEPKINEIILN